MQTKHSVSQQPRATGAPPILTAATLQGSPTALPQCCPTPAHTHSWGLLPPISAQAGRWWVPEHSPQGGVLGLAQRVGPNSTQLVDMSSPCHPPVTSASMPAAAPSLASAPAGLLLNLGEFGSPPLQPQPLLGTSVAQHGLATSGMGRGTQAGVQQGP